MDFEYIGNKTKIIGEMMYVRQYINTRTGLLACGARFENLFISSNSSRNSRPDLQICGDDGTKGDNIYYIQIAQQYTTPRRSVTLSNASNLLADPIVSAPIFSQEDYQAFYLGIQNIRKLVTFYPLSASLGKEINPGPTPDGQSEYEYLMSYIANNVGAYAHYVGSTAIGNDTYPYAVLDSQFRVRGIKNLRVCDLGSMPYLLNGNTHFSALMVGGRCANFILNNKN